jgi:acyl-CoA synthetase (AMP-forming)/AMP-acid ligase II
MAMATMEATTLTALLKEAAAAFSTRRAVAVPSSLELTHAVLDALIDAAAARLAADAGFLLGHVVALSFPNTIEVRLLLSNSIGHVPAYATQSPRVAGVGT